MTWQRLKVSIPDDYTPQEREDFGVLIADFIRERTAEGIGVRNGRNYKFPPYSAAYVSSLAFKTAGKSKSQVNLRLSEDMLTDLGVISTKPGEVIIGFERGSDSNEKAEGNILGSYGRDPNPRRARNFLGVTKSELAALVKKFERERG